MKEDPSRVPAGSLLALVVLVALVVLSPWPFGCTHPIARWLITHVCLLTAAGILLLRLLRRESVESPVPAVLATAAVCVGILQLIPLPPAVHAMLAPGSASLWHPDLAAAAQVLGDGPRPVSVWPEMTRRAAAFWIGLIALAVLAIPALRERRHAVRAASVIAASGCTVAVYGLVARVLFGDKLFGILEVPTIAPFGPFVSKNHFAGYVEMAGLLCLGLAAGLADTTGPRAGALGWISNRRAASVVLAYGAAGALVLAVLASLSRGSAGSLAIGTAAFVVLRWGHLRGSRSGPSARVMFVTLIVVAGAAGLVALPSEVRGRLQTISDGARDPSAAYRLEVWESSLQLAATSLLVGQGVGTFVDALPPYKKSAGNILVQHAENDYLEVLAEGGLIGLLLVLSAVLTAGLAARRAAMESKDLLRRGIVTGATASLVALGCHSFLDFNLRIPSNALLAVLLAAIVLSCQPPSRRPRVGVAALLVLCGLALSFVPCCPHPSRLDGLGSVHAVRVRATATPLRLLRAEHTLRQHLRRRPGDAEGWVWLAWIRTALGHPHDGAALATYGASLDPQRRALRESAARLAH